MNEREINLNRIIFLVNKIQIQWGNWEEKQCILNLDVKTRYDLEIKCMYDFSGAFTMQLQVGINYRICVTMYY